MKRISYAVFLTLWIFTLKGQQGIEVGAAIQPQIYGQLYTDDIPDKSGQIPYSMAIGINVGYNFSELLGVRTGFVYSPEGERFTLLNPLTSLEDSYDISLEYLKVPLWLKFNSNPNNRLSFAAFGGPHIAFLNSAESVINDDNPISILGEYKRFVLGASGALGLQLNLGDGSNINLVWRTSFSVQTIQKEAELSSYSVNSGIFLAYHYYLQI